MNQREIFKAALQEIADRSGGQITPEGVVAAAEHPDSPLHSAFDWDDSTAAVSWRLEQARALIRSVKVVITVEERTVRAPYFVRDPEKPWATQGYTSLPRLLSDEDAARAAVLAEFARASSALARARTLATALDVRDGIEAVVAELESIQARLMPVSKGRPEARA